MNFAFSRCATDDPCDVCGRRRNPGGLRRAALDGRGQQPEQIQHVLDAPEGGHGRVPLVPRRTVDVVPRPVKATPRSGVTRPFAWMADLSDLSIPGACRSDSSSKGSGRPAGRADDDNPRAALCSASSRSFRSPITLFQYPSLRSLAGPVIFSASYSPLDMMLPNSSRAARSGEENGSYFECHRVDCAWVTSRRAVASYMNSQSSS